MDNWVYLLGIHCLTWVLDLPKSTSIARWRHLNLLLSDLDLFRVSFGIRTCWEEALFLPSLVLSLIECAFVDLLSIWATSNGSTGSYSSNMGVISCITVFSLDWLCDWVVQVHDKVVVDHIFVRWLGFSHWLSVGSSSVCSFLVSRNSIICGWVVVVLGLLDCVVVYWLISWFGWLINSILFNVNDRSSHVEVLLFWRIRWLWFLFSGCLVHIYGVFLICAQPHLFLEIDLGKSVVFLSIFNLSVSLFN